MKTLSKSEQKIEPKEGCISSCLLILGNKWTALILNDLVSGPRRFTELERSLKGISPRTLSQRLDDLEAHKIVTKKAYGEVPPRIDYELTEKGFDFIPILKQMAAWGTKHS